MNPFFGVPQTPMGGALFGAPMPYQSFLCGFPDPESCVRCRVFPTIGAFMDSEKDLPTASALNAPDVLVRPAASAFKAWAVFAVLLLLPLVAYWPTIFHNYGLRDGYSTLREAHEEPGKVLHFCASHARPIYGWMLEAAFRQISTIRDLQWIRLLSALLLGTLSWLSYHGLRALGWSTTMSLSFALWIALVPSAQVIAGWSIGWPYAAAAILAFGAFFAVEAATSADSWSWRTATEWFVGLTMLVVSALIYQPSALFYAVPLTAALIAQRDRSFTATVQWGLIHLGFVIGALGLTYCVISATYAAGIFERSSRVAFDHDWGTKIAWFLKAPLPNALSLFVINDDNHRDHSAYLACAVLVGLVLVAGAGAEWLRHGWSRGLVWFAGLLGLPTFAFVVNLVAAERYSTYRTILTMTAVLLCFLLASFGALTGWCSPRTRRLAAIIVIAAAFLTARHRAYALLAVPQGNEWQLINEGAARVRLEGDRPRIFAIEPTPADISTDTIYHDEFGSLSSNSDWVPKEMFKRAMHDLHPGVPNLDQRYEFSFGLQPPAGRQFDVIIDLRKLRTFHTDN